MMCNRLPTALADLPLKYLHGGLMNCYQSKWYSESKEGATKLAEQVIEALGLKSNTATSLCRGDIIKLWEWRDEEGRVYFRQIKNLSEVKAKQEDSEKNDSRYRKNLEWKFLNGTEKKSRY